MSDWYVERQAVTPRDCALAIGIPVHPASFQHGRETGGDAFAARFRGGWPHYRERVLDPLQYTARHLSSWGATVVAGATLKNFSDLFHTHRVVILFSHWGDDAIEFDEGFIEYPAVVDGVPRSFNGTLDLCVCHPRPLVARLDIARPKCEIIYAEAALTSYAWSAFYLAVFAALRAGTAAYADVVQAVSHEFEFQAKGGSTV